MNEGIDEAFAPQIDQLRQWLAGADAEVSWNERDPDPATAAAPVRDIEIFLKRNGRFWIAGCRAAAAPQDADWIDELAARRDSSNADAAVAISSGGFTTAALQKAHRRGIIARDLASLSAEEINAWGAVTPVMLIFYEFRDMEVTITLPEPIATNDLVITNPQGQPIPAREVLIKCVQNYTKNLDENFVAMRGNLQGGILVNGVAPRGIAIEGRMRSRRYGTEVPAVTIYGKAAPGAESGESATLSSIVLDLSKIEVPERCIFGLALLAPKDGGETPPGDVIGTENAMQSKVNMKYLLKWQDAAAR